MTSIKQDLQDSRNYSKSDYKVHVSPNNRVVDHCSTYALSNTADKCWCQSCDHRHDQQCDRCELLKVTLIKIQTVIEDYVTDLGAHDRLLHRLRQQIQYVQDWKAHLLRTIHQDQTRVDILDNLNEETVMADVDWAMKWLPVKYRKSSKDQLVKCGLSWHIAYVICNNSSTNSKSFDTSFDSDVSAHMHILDESNYENKIFCHVFDQCVQNATTVISSIIRHIFLCLRQTLPNIKFLHLRSDNAGCYHGSESLLSVVQIFKETGIWIKSIDFSDPQSGKGPCDRCAAVIKCSIRRFINEKMIVQIQLNF
ncbi:unnamed protein product [Adineta ricciae]|uniref:Uncharacterized protein n=1 Tax=Adineta ricciae TaxID=249248 RepID=A0A815RXP7_ADIRI|nr:unnamed protein product [Adineta ricciae]CAF1626597.1 unnamed protein product [Adineta ricciae]